MLKQFPLQALPTYNMHPGPTTKKYHQIGLFRCHLVPREPETAKEAGISQKNGVLSCSIQKPRFFELQNFH